MIAFLLHYDKQIWTSHLEDKTQLIHLYLTGQHQPLMHPTQPVYQAAAVDVPYGYPIMFPPSPYRQLSPMMVRYLRALLTISDFRFQIQNCST